MPYVIVDWIQNRSTKRRRRGRLARLAPSAVLVLATVIAPVATVATAVTGATAATAAVPASTCTHRAAITGFEFKPRTVDEGSTATLLARLTNCSATAFSGSFESFGRLACQVVDPIERAVDLPPHSLASFTARYSIPDCTGNGEITGRLLTTGRPDHLDQDRQGNDHCF